MSQAPQEAPCNLRQAPICGLVMETFRATSPESKCTSKDKGEADREEVYKGVWGAETDRHTEAMRQTHKKRERVKNKQRQRERNRDKKTNAKTEIETHTEERQKPREN